jgi:hypothetical protein
VAVAALIHGLSSWRPRFSFIVAAKARTLAAEQRGEAIFLASIVQLAPQRLGRPYEPSDAIGFARPRPSDYSQRSGA